MSTSIRAYEKILSRAVPFVADTGVAFARVAARANAWADQYLALRSPAFRDWFFAQAWSETNSIPTTHAWNSILALLDAQAAANIECHGQIVNRRVGPGHDSTILLDLANPAGDFVHITPAGWSLNPADTGKLRAERSQARVRWKSGAVLILRGPTGSGKSLAARVLRTLIDPSTTPFNPTPRTSRDLLALARDNWILAFDHVTTLSPAVSDTLCRLTSGASVPQFVKRPILLTATDDFTPAPDLAARSLTVTLSPLTVRRPETELTDTLFPLLPQILAALCTVVYRALSNTQPISTPTRHANALSWTTAAFPDLAADLATAITAPPPPPKLVRAVQSLLAAQPNQTWTGPATDLLAVLPEASAPNVLSKLLTTHPLALHDADITLIIDRKNRTRSITLSSSPISEPSPQPAPSQPFRPPENTPSTDAPIVTSVISAFSNPRDPEPVPITAAVTSPNSPRDLRVSASEFTRDGRLVPRSKPGAPPCYNAVLWHPSPGIIITTMPTRDGSCPNLSIEPERTPAAITRRAFFVSA